MIDFSRNHLVLYNYKFTTFSFGAILFIVYQISNFSVKYRNYFFNIIKRFNILNFLNSCIDSNKWIIIFLLMLSLMRGGEKVCGIKKKGMVTLSAGLSLTYSLQDISLCK